MHFVAQGTAQDARKGFAQTRTQWRDQWFFQVLGDFAFFLARFVSSAGFLAFSRRSGSSQQQQCSTYGVPYCRAYTTFLSSTTQSEVKMGRAGGREDCCCCCPVRQRVSVVSHRQRHLETPLETQDGKLDVSVCSGIVVTPVFQEFWATYLEGEVTSMPDKIPMRFVVDDREVTADEWNLTYSTNGTTLRAACKGEGLAVSGTNAQRARRLIQAGLSQQQVLDKYGWRARQAGRN